MVKELVVQKRAMVRLDPTQGDHGSVVEAVMDPTKDLNSREELLLLGVTLD